MKKRPNNHHGSKASRLGNKPDPNARIRVELALLLQCADETAKTAATLTDLILSHQQSLLSDTTVVRETAVLLQHAVQNLDRITQPILAGKPTDTRKTRQ